MGFYENVRDDVVAKQLGTYGMSMTFRHIVKGVYDPNTGTMGTDTITDYTCKGLIQAIDSKGANIFYGTGTLKDSLIRSDDQLILLAAIQTNGQVLPVEPKAVDDVLVINTVTYQIVKVVALAPAGIPVMFYCQVRK